MLKCHVTIFNGNTTNAEMNLWQSGDMSALFKLFVHYYGNGMCFET